MDKVNIGESTLKDFGDAINEAADILNKGKVAFDNTIPDKTLQVLPYTGQAGAFIPSKIGDLDDLTTTAKDNLVNAINEVNNNLQNNTNVVTLDTDQTITGVKTFAQGIHANDRIYLGYGTIQGKHTDGLRLSTDDAAVGSNNINIVSGNGGNLSLHTKDGGGVDIYSSGVLSFGMDSSGGLMMDTNAISEFKRVLQIPSTANLIDQTTNQSISSTKTFTTPPVSPTNPSNAHHMTNKAYVDAVGNAKVALSGNQTIAGNKTFSGVTTTAALTANGNTALNGNTTFKLIPNCAVKPTGNNHLANKLYVDNLGGVITSGAAIDFRKGNHFMVNLSANAQITVANWGGVAGKSGTITILNANRITGFRAPFNFRVAQSGFTGTEVFSYYCYSSGLIRIVRS